MPGMPGTFSPPRNSKGAISYRSRHASRQARHARAMSWSLIRGGGENTPGIPGGCATRIFAYLARGPFPCLIQLAGLYLIIPALTEATLSALTEICVRKICFTVPYPKVNSRHEALDLCAGSLAIFPADMIPSYTYDFPKLCEHFPGPFKTWVTTKRQCQSGCVHGRSSYVCSYVPFSIVYMCT